MSSNRVCLIATLFLSANLVCIAQVEQGAITGAVTDPTGSSVPGAKVTATNQATGTPAETETTADGYYKIPYLLAGKYTVTMQKDGFDLAKVVDVPVLVGQSATINVTLKPGSLHN